MNNKLYILKTYTKDIFAVIQREIVDYILYTHVLAWEVYLTTYTVTLTSPIKRKICLKMTNNATHMILKNVACRKNKNIELRY